MSFLKNLGLCLLSAVLLVVSFPQMEWAPLAFVAFVPLFFALDGQKSWKAFRRAYLCGFIFFAGTLGWFIYVTYVGAFLLIAYLSVYFALFGLAFVYFQRLPLLLRIIVLSAVWVALEFVRSHIFSGFGWVCLGHSQYQNLLLAQIADLTGVYGVSFLVMMVNLLVFESIRAVIPECFYTLIPGISKGHRESRPPTKAFGGDKGEAFGGDKIVDLYYAQIMAAVLLLTSLSYGFFVLTRPHAWPLVKVGVVQPNIPQSIKWEPQLQPWIVDQTISLTGSLAQEQPEIIIWPETSLPGITSEVPELTKKISDTARQIDIPILYGAISREGKDYYNSALLVNGQGHEAARYDKIHLVPFGEYLPLRPLLAWIVDKIVPLEDFTPGMEYTVFEAGSSQKTFGVLICFEDTVAYLRRNLAKAGAGFFVNITNDAWFEDTKAPFLHMQAAVFGSIENRRSLVRAANTGLSAFIDPFGRVLSMVRSDLGKEAFISGAATASVPVVNETTFYTKHGDVFAFSCFLVILIGIARMKINLKGDLCLKRSF